MALAAAQAPEITQQASLFVVQLVPQRIHARLL
jgi:hypothetical protein